MSGKLSFAVWFCESLLIEECRVYLLKKASQMNGKTLFPLSQTVIQWCILPPHHPLPPSFLVFSCLPHWYSLSCFCTFPCDWNLTYWLPVFSSVPFTFTWIPISIQSFLDSTIHLFPAFFCPCPSWSEIQKIRHFWVFFQDAFKFSIVCTLFFASSFYLLLWYLTSSGFPPYCNCLGHIHRNWIPHHCFVVWYVALISCWYVLFVVTR